MSNTKFKCLLFLGIAFLGCADIPDDLREEAKGNGGKRSSSSVGSSSSIQSGIVYGTPVNYGGETYNTVKIGTQTWMARNLNYTVEGSRCYDDGPANCTTYGKLYDWATAMALSSSCNFNSCASQISAKHRGICPPGWHIPSDDEWTTLENFVGASTAGTKLKSTSGWYGGGNGTDDYGFSALPGGGGFSGGLFSGVGYYGLWWTATEDGASGAYYRLMGYDGAYVGSSSIGKTLLYSVRCVQD